MRALAFAIALLWSACAWAQHSNPQVGDVWLYFGPTLGAGWGDNPTTSNLPNNTILGNVSGVAAPATALTATQATTLCNVFTSLLKGCVPASGGDAGTYLNGAGGFTTPAGTGITQLTGDGTAGPGSGSVAFTLANMAVTPGSYTATNLTVDAKGRITAASSGSSGGTAINQLTGDVTAGPGVGSQVATLATSGVSAGTYTKITVDAKGRATVGATAACADLSDDGAGCTAGAASTSTAGIVKLHNIPVAVGWPAALNPNSVILANINQASTISAIVGTVETATGSAATVSVFKAPSGTACGSGTVLHSGSFNANGTAATDQTLTITTSSLAAGDRLCLQTTGTTSWTGGSGVGTITVFLAPS